MSPPRLDLFQLKRMLMQHLFLGLHAREHGLVEAFDMHTVHMPNDDGQHRKDSFAWYRGVIEANGLTFVP